MIDLGGYCIFLFDLSSIINRICFAPCRVLPNTCLFSWWQDYKAHRDEIHTKLVQIMRERVLFHLRNLPGIVESWNRPEDADLQPSGFARSVVKVIPQ